MKDEIKRYFALSKDELKKFNEYEEILLSKVDINDSNYDTLKKELQMGIFRDIQAQRLPPNIKVPSRIRHPFKYINTLKEHVGLKNAIIGIFGHGSWTSSGGSFKLADDSGYDILAMMKDTLNQKGSANYLEIGAAYAGLKTENLTGVNKLIKNFEGDLGDKVNIYFTNLTSWHKNLPNGVKEFPGYVAREIVLLNEKEHINPDLIYSQAAAYFEPKIELFIQGAGEILSPKGKLLFNGKITDDEKITSEAKNVGLDLEYKKDYGENNGNFYVFNKQ
jgi:hypothetical protein